MGVSKNLPGHWLELRPIPVVGIGLGPALGWLAGGLAAGRPLWTWPALGWLLLGLFLIAAVWGRLWMLLGNEARQVFADPAEPAKGNPSRRSRSSGPSRSARRSRKSAGASQRPTPFLPYTVSGSLSATWETTLKRTWQYLSVDTRRRWLVEVLALTTVLLVTTGLGGSGTLLMGLVGLALLGLHLLTGTRPAARTLLRLFGGLAWPWWLGQVLWGQLGGEGVLVGLLWGAVYAALAELVGRTIADSAVSEGEDGTRTGGRAWPILLADLAQAGVVALFVLLGRPIVGAALVLILLGQVLLQARLARAGSWPDIADRTWPLAGLGVLVAGLALGGWV